MVEIEWGHGPRQERVNEVQLDAVLDRIDAEARRMGRPQNVQVTVHDAGTLGIVLGVGWSVLDHVPPDLNPPYLVTVGEDPSSEPVVFYVAGDHYSETLRCNTISVDAARSAMRHFVATGKLSPDLTWEEVYGRPDEWARVPPPALHRRGRLTAAPPASRQVGQVEARSPAGLRPSLTRKQSQECCFQYSFHSAS